MPRPDLARLGIAYRRIPVLAIGRDVYVDSRLILEKLEALYPPSEAHPPLAAATGEHAAIERLFSLVSTDGGLFCMLLGSDPFSTFHAPFLLRKIRTKGRLSGLQGPWGGKGEERT